MSTGPMKPWTSQDEEFLAYLRQVLNYDPETGKLTWLVRVAPRVRIGDEAGNVTTRGYKKVSVRYRPYQAHRLAWLLTFGRWPNDQIDHINGDRADNRLCNLRECNHSENQQNRKTAKNSTSGLTGVTWHKDQKRWRTQIGVGRRKYHIGHFDSKEEAYAAYLRAKADLHDFHPEPRQEDT